MTLPAGTPGNEVPAEDWAEQAADTGSGAQDAAAVPAGATGTGSWEANEADLAEQGLTVDFDDDDR